MKATEPIEPNMPDPVTAEQLATFCIVAKYESVSAAAGALGLSQPAVSRRLRILEDAHGLPLYERSGGGIALTPAGSMLLPYACEVYDALRRAQRFMSGALPPIHASMRVGLSHHLTTRFTGALLRAAKNYAARGSDLELHLVEAYSRDLVASVEEGRLDAAYVLRTNPYEGEHTKGRRVGIERIVLLVKPDDPLSEDRRVTLNALAGETLVLPSSASEVFLRMQEAIRAHGMRPGRVLEVSGPTAVRGAVMDGLGIGVTLGSFVAADVASGALVAIRPEEDDLTTDVCEVTRQEGRLFPWQRRALHEIRAEVDAAGEP